MKDLTIGKIAKLADVGIETIRFYERKGLLKEPLRKPSGYRVYGREDVLRLGFIKRAKDLGFTLNEIKELFNLREKHKKKQSILKLADEKIADIDGKISSLKKMKKALESLTVSCKHGHHKSDCPLLAALDENSLVSKLSLQSDR